MSRKLYVRSFTALATMFVPVVLFFGLVDYVVPSAFIALFVGNALLQAKFAQALWAFGQLAVYWLLFYAAARITFRLSMCSGSSKVRRTIQVIVLITLFSCSFIRAVTYSSIQGRGGTYTFWEAASRLLDKHQSR